MIRAIRLCFVFTLLAVPALAQTAAPRATLYTEIDTLFADTGADPITPAQLRTSLKNITASSYNGLTDGVVSSTYLPLAGGTLTGGLVLPSTNTDGIKLYNTADQSTNYERLEILYSGSVAYIRNVIGGTGTMRALHLASGARNVVIKQSAVPFVEFGTGSTGGVGNYYQFTTTNTATTGPNAIVAIKPTYNQASGTAANTDLLIDRTETAVGSGAQNLADFQVGGTSKFKVSNSGAVTATGAFNKVTLTTPATGSTLTIADGKTLTASNTLTLTATDGSTLAVGAGGTLGTAAYTAATAYATSAQGTKADNVGAVNGLVKSNGSASFSAASAGTDYVVPGGALGTPSSGTGTNLTGIPIASGISGLGTSVAAFLADPTYAKLNTALTGDDAAGLAANNAFTGINSFAGATVKPANALGAFAIDVTKGINTKTISADQTFTFSGTPASAGTFFSLKVTNSDASAHTLTIPSSFAPGVGTITSVVISASDKLFLTWEYDGSAYNLYGAPLLTTGTGNVVLSTSPTLVTPALGTPSALVLTNATALPAAQVVAGALADGMTATTQTVGDNDTSLATTAFANAAAKATKLGSHASPDTTGGAITWATSAVYEVWTNTTTEYDLPAASGYDGKAVIFYVTGTNAITIDPNSSEVIVRDGTAQTGGVTLTLTGAAGNYVCLICDGTRWVTLGYKGTLAAGS